MSLFKHQSFALVVIHLVYELRGMLMVQDVLPCITLAMVMGEMKRQKELRVNVHVEFLIFK